MVRKSTTSDTMNRLIDSIRRGVPAGQETTPLARTLWWRRRDDMLTFFDYHDSNGPTERSTAAWKHCAATHSDSAISPTADRSLLHSGATQSLGNAL